MAKSLFSPSWYRVAELKLRLRRHAQIHRQKFRGEIWYVLQDHQTGRFHRLSASANLMISLMDGYCGFYMAQTSNNLSRDYGISREAQDAFALESQRRAAHAIAAG
ncbi:MAG: hypothetical protein ABJB10_00465, partial [Mesorhizobium sp.]